MNSLTAEAFESAKKNQFLKKVLLEFAGDPLLDSKRASALYNTYTSTEYYNLAKEIEKNFPAFESITTVSNPQAVDIKFDRRHPAGPNNVKAAKGLFAKIRDNLDDPDGERSLLKPDLEQSPTIALVGLLFEEIRDQVRALELSEPNKDTVLNQELRKAIMNQTIYLYYFLIFLWKYQSGSARIGEIAKDSGILTSEDLFSAKLGLLEDIIEQEKEHNRELQSGEIMSLAAAAAGEFATSRQAIIDSRFIAQKYLIQNMESLDRLSRERISKRVTAGYDQQPIGIPQNRLVRLKNSHLHTISSLTGASSGKKIFNMKTGTLSRLQPEIRIFKTKYDKEMAKKGEVEIKFPTHNDLSMFKYNPNFAKKKPLEFPKTKRGFGIKSFSWSYTGADPFSVDKDIEAVLELYFQDFAQFTALRGMDEDKTYRYIDLIVPLDGEQQGAKENLGAIFNNDIRIQAGWQRPESMSDAEANAITAGNIDLHLTMQDYSLTFDGNANGAASITINYRARAETAAKNKLINILAPTKEEMTDILSTKTAIAALGIIDESSGKREELIKEKTQIETNARNRAVKNLVETLIDEKSIYWRDINTRGVLDSALGKPTAKRAVDLLALTAVSADGKYTDGLKSSLEDIKSTITPPSIKDLALLKNIKDREKPPSVPDSVEAGTQHRILYTFFGDIVQAAMQHALDPEHAAEMMGTPKDILENMKLICSEFKVGGKSYNIADLPIDMVLFTQFLYDTIGSTQISSKPIAMFIKELLAQVVINNADKYISLKDGNTRTFRLGYHSLKNPLKPIPEREYDLEDKDDTRLFVQGANYEYLVLYSDSPTPAEFLITNGDGPDSYKNKRKRNEENGIFHFVLGTTTSLVKNISFEKIDLEYARERRLTIEKNDPYALLANVFNVNIQMFGNNLFRPGSYIYIDPRILGSMGNPWDKNSISNVMGLGGYHFVTQVKNTITNNSFETSIDAVWNSSGDGEVVFGGSETKPKRQEKK